MVTTITSSRTIKLIGISRTIGVLSYHILVWSFRWLLLASHRQIAIILIVMRDTGQGLVPVIVHFFRPSVARWYSLCFAYVFAWRGIRGGIKFIYVPATNSDQMKRVIYLQVMWLRLWDSVELLTKQFLKTRNDWKLMWIWK